MHPSHPAEVVEVVGPILRAMTLAPIGTAADKTQRGCVLVVGGSRETPGGVLLAGTAALRLGAGRVVLATARSVAASLSIAMPEARVIALDETAEGALRPAAPTVLREAAAAADAVLLGSGALDARATGELVQDLVPSICDATVVFDAAALPVLMDDPDLLAPLRDRAVAMPNVNEMARMLRCDPNEVEHDAVGALTSARDLLDVAIALRGVDTWITAPGAAIYHDSTGHPALATPGSGDVLGGALAACAARERNVLNALLWAVHVHGTAGELAASRGHGIGTLAREIADELPGAMRSLDGW